MSGDKSRRGTRVSWEDTCWSLESVVKDRGVVYIQRKAETSAAAEPPTQHTPPPLHPTTGCQWSIFWKRTAWTWLAVTCTPASWHMRKCCGIRCCHIPALMQANMRHAFGVLKWGTLNPWALLKKPSFGWLWYRRKQKHQHPWMVDPSISEGKYGILRTRLNYLNHRCVVANYKEVYCWNLDVCKCLFDCLFVCLFVCFCISINCWHPICWVQPSIPY